ncbi:MAG: L-seryl-tRNA(Sec) selenium transferase [Pyrinomonadaceae bacterium]
MAIPEIQPPKRDAQIFKPMRSQALPKTSDPALLPSVDEMLIQADGLIAELGRERVVVMVRSLLAEKRGELLGGGPSGDREALIAEIAGKLAALANADRLTGVRRVINATGVVIHTNLGRAPLSTQAVSAMEEASGYSAIEYDVTKGSRGPRGAKAVNLLKQLTGAEDALVVNNCAAAALLVLAVFAQGREVIVSRGELVEIGGDFRIPDILERSGAVLREVGTTNRTHLRDYERAISDRTAMVLKVHPSNFRITGFTTTPETAELAALARKNGVVFYEDAGSGALTDLAAYGINGEPPIREILAAGADLVSFSGDKLLGGPQAGIIAGRGELVEKLRRDPFYRALRLDKTITAALEATLDAYARGVAESEIPVLRMLSAASEEIASRAGRFVQRMAEMLRKDPVLELNLITGLSAVGGGAAPDSALETTLITVTHAELTETELEQILRSASPPIIARIEAGQVLLDLRTLSKSDEDLALRTIARLFNDPKGLPTWF